MLRTLRCCGFAAETFLALTLLTKLVIKISDITPGRGTTATRLEAVTARERPAKAVRALFHIDRLICLGVTAVSLHIFDFQLCTSAPHDFSHRYSIAECRA